ncbi:MAG: hypothetical protein PHI98_01250 [Eubacteriales bacterium]|nr:hypothetical protein [Eubacteriales bacterium]
MTREAKRLSVSGLDKLRHAIGFHQVKATGRTHRKFAAIRAHYNATVPDGDMEQAKDAGLVTLRKTEDGNYQYVLTQEGIAFLSEVLECEITCPYARE